MVEPARILLLFAHPAYQRSRINRAMIEAVQDFAQVRLHDLYEEYPHFHIDVKREQKLLREHDVIVFQHPFYWYSCPALLKEWLDLVLEYNFAYGDSGTELAGKKWMSAITTGGPAEAYLCQGQNCFTMEQFLVPFEQTARLCNMAWQPPFIVHGSLRLTRDSARDIGSTYVARLQTLLAPDSQPNPAAHVAG
jgi:glutathione-regulated potassium-efflux system ancillary protein KefG